MVFAARTAAICLSTSTSSIESSDKAETSSVALQLNLDNNYGMQHGLFFDVMVWDTGLFSAYLTDGTPQQPCDNATYSTACTSKAI